METRRCTRCGLEKPYADFGKHTGGLHGLRARCKSCRSEENVEYLDRDGGANRRRMNERSRGWAIANAERSASNQAAWHQANRERRCADARELRAVHWTKDPVAVMLKRIRARAKKCGIRCTISVDDLQIPASCPVLGIPIDVTMRGRRGPRATSPSVDRIVPALGYVPGNVRVISHRANTLKCDATTEELELVLIDLRRLRGT